MRRTATPLLVPLLLVALAAPATRAQDDRPDRDGDLTADPEDACPDDPEDGDGFEDRDGCPDDDDDGDAVPDAIDQCGRDAETRNGHEDDDGCPDALPAQPVAPSGCVDGRACKAAGDAAWTAGDLATAALSYRRACALGDVGGCGAYGAVVDSGRGAAQSLPVARSLYRFACARRVREACHNLGLMLRDGRGAPASAARAQVYFGQACDLGLPQACTTLGRPLPAAPTAPAAPATGTCTDATTCDASAWAAFGAKQVADAARLGQRACDLGAARGCALMSHLYEQGQGVPRDLAKALAHARKACAGGNQSGCHNLAYRLAAGDVVPKDLVEARRLYTGACQAGLQPSCTQLAALPQPSPLDPALAAFDAKDYRTAATLAKPLCDGGDMEACGTQGTARWELGARKEALALWQKACDGGEGWACGELADVHWSGDGVPADRTRAFALAKLGCQRGDAEACRTAGSWAYTMLERGVDWFARACDMQDAEGCAAAAHSYRDGDFGPKDATEAVRFGRRACELGALRECTLVGLAECDGHGTARDANACKRHLDEACRGGDTAACAALRARFP